jgi:hypothetical protein
MRCAEGWFRASGINAQSVSGSTKPKDQNQKENEA